MTHMVPSSAPQSDTCVEHRPLAASGGVPEAGAEYMMGIDEAGRGSVIGICSP